MFGTLYGTVVNQEQLHRHLILGLKAKQDHLAFLYKQAKSLKHASFKQNYPELLFCLKILYCILCFIRQKWAGKHQNSHSQALLPVSSTSSQTSVCLAQHSEHTRLSDSPATTENGLSAVHTGIAFLLRDPQTMALEEDLSTHYRIKILKYQDSQDYACCSLNIITKQDCP